MASPLPIAALLLLASAAAASDPFSVPLALPPQIGAPFPGAGGNPDPIFSFNTARLPPGSSPEAAETDSLLEGAGAYDDYLEKTFGGSASVEDLMGVMSEALPEPTVEAPASPAGAPESYAAKMSHGAISVVSEVRVPSPSPSGGSVDESLAASREVHGFLLAASAMAAAVFFL